MATAASTAPDAQRNRAPAGALSLFDRVRLPLHQLRRALRQPSRLRRLHHGAVLASLHSLFEEDELGLLRHHFNIDATTLRRLEGDLLGDAAFRSEVESRYRRVRGENLQLFGASSAEDCDRGYRLLYYLVRLAKPRVIVETGVFDGVSSAFLLKALADNDSGRLCSIDLPARQPIAASTDKMLHDALPAGCEPGWIVPDELRPRWTLRLGSSADLLEPWLAELGSIDLFFHDSLHTTANMRAELETAWRHLAGGGFAVVDDVFWNRAFRSFAAARRQPGHVFRGVGLLRKDGAEARSDA